MDFSFSHLSQQRACATLLAYTAHSFLPILKPIQSTVRPWGFYCDFIAENPVDELVLTLLSEQMRRLVRADLAYSSRTMLAHNAGDFLKKLQPLQSLLVQDLETALVELIEIDSFYDVVQEEGQICLKSTGEIEEFVLVCLEKKAAVYPLLPDVDVVRIHGAVFSDKKACKAYVKAFALAAKEDLLEKARAADLVVLSNGWPCWYPRGIALYEEITTKWKELCKKQGIWQINAPSHQLKETHLSLLERLKDRCHATGQWVQFDQDIAIQQCEGLFQTKQCLQDFVFRLCSFEQFDEQLISSLQFIQELHSINSIETKCVFVCSKARRMQVLQEKMQQSIEQYGLQVTLEESSEVNAGPLLEFRIQDLRGRQWLFAYVEAELSGKSVRIIHSAFVSLERLVAIILERGGFKKA